MRNFTFFCGKVGKIGSERGRQSVLWRLWLGKVPENNKKGKLSKLFYHIVSYMS